LEIYQKEYSSIIRYSLDSDLEETMLKITKFVISHMYCTF